MGNFYAGVIKGRKAFLRNILELANLLDTPAHLIAYGLEDPDDEKNAGYGGTAVKTTTEIFLPLRDGVSPEKAMELLFQKLKARHIEASDIIHITILRDEDEDEDGT